MNSYTICEYKINSNVSILNKKFKNEIGVALVKYEGCNNRKFTKNHLANIAKN